MSNNGVDMNSGHSMFSPHLQPGGDVEIVQAIMFKTARYDDIYLRPYETHYDSRVAEALHTSTEGGSKISVASLASSASDFIRPSTVVNGKATLENGFGEHRFTVMMELLYPTGGVSGGLRKILTGYTDYFGVIQSRTGPILDPMMHVYFNSLITLRDTSILGPHGMVTHTNVVGDNHILTSSGYGDYMTNHQPQRTLRPEDIMANLDITNNPILAGFDPGRGDFDQRTRLTQTKTSSRDNSSRASYLSKTINGYTTAQAQQASYDESGMLFSDAKSYVAEEPMARDSFLNQMISNHTFRNSGYITYGELCAMLPTFDYQVKVIEPNAKMIANEYNPGQGEQWSGTTNETIAATILSQSVPAIMTGHMLTEIVIHATNNVIGGQHDVRVSHMRGFASGIDYTQYLTAFIERFKVEVLNDISRYNQIQYNVSATIDLMRDSHFQISLDGGPIIYYASPSFCDGLYAPVIASSDDSLMNMSHDVGLMLGNITDHSSPSQHYGNNGSSI